MADYVISNLTTAVSGISSQRTLSVVTTVTDFPAITNKDSGVFANPLRSDNTPGGMKRIGEISINDLRTTYLPDSRKFVDPDVNRPASGQLYPRFNK